MIITSDLYSLDLGLIPGKGSNMRSDAEVAIKFHKLEVSGSIPLSATIYNIKYMEEEKQMKVLAVKNIRMMITEVNKLKIQKEDIVLMHFDEGQYLLIYYGI